MARRRSARFISRRSRRYREGVVKGSENGTIYEISETFSIDDEDTREIDRLVDIALRRGSIKGRSV